MANVVSEVVNTPPRSLLALPAVRQIAMLVGLAASIALGFWVVLWSQETAYQPLYGNLGEQEAGEIMEVLRTEEIPYRLDSASGAVMVPMELVHKTRIKLASSGLPRGTAAGFELMDKSQGFGTSQFLETARYQRALEGELGHTISSLRNVKSARVHLAIPKQASFVRARRPPSASVMLALFAGRRLSEEQLAGIVHLVSSSIPELTPKGVSVVDQQGQLLTSSTDGGQLGLNNQRFKHTKRLEQDYIKRIEDILSPLVGYGKVRAQVAAALDFTVTEQTSESFDPERRQLRSEAVAREERTGSALALGVPGALTNQPPAAGVAPEQIETEAVENTAAVEQRDKLPKSTSERSTNNYELDKTISHVRFAPGKLNRLSVAVVIDNPDPPPLAPPPEGAAPDAEPAPGAEIPAAAPAAASGYSDEQIQRFTELVKQTVGYDEARGDSVTVVNAAFTPPKPPEPIPDPPLWEQPWLYDVVKQVAAGIVVLLLILFVLRPTMRNLTAREEPELLPSPEGSADNADGQAQLAAPGEDVAQLEQLDSYENDMEAARTMVTEDPERVAQVVKNWVID